MGAILGKFLLPRIWDFVSNAVVNKFFNGNKRAIVEKTGTSLEEWKSGKEEQKKEKSPTVEDDERVTNKFGDLKFDEAEYINVGCVGCSTNNYNHAKNA